MILLGIKSHQNKRFYSFIQLTSLWRSHLVFIDLEKALDFVPREFIWQALQTQLVPEHYIEILKDMYHSIKSRDCSPHGVGPEIHITVHQGSTLSTLLFNIVIDYATKHIQKPAPWALLYADDIVFIAKILQT